jgi:hypothetical protein
MNGSIFGSMKKLSAPLDIALSLKRNDGRFMFQCTYCDTVSYIHYLDVLFVRVAPEIKFFRTF